jgi:hypothetical protein
LDQTTNQDKPQLFYHLEGSAKILSVIVEDGLAWKVGNGNKVRLGTDPWPGSGHSHLLPDDVKAVMQENGFLFLNQIADPVHSSLWSQAWLNHAQVGLNEDMAPLGITILQV